MFRELRNKSKRIETEEMECILRSQAYGTLATSDDGGYPYASPSMFLYQNGEIYLHCAKRGHKLENVLRDPRVSFCVVEETAPDTDTAEKEYRSVIVFGEVHIVENADERMNAFIGLCRKFDMMFKIEDPDYIRKRDAATEVLRIDVEQMTGKKL